MAKKVRFTPKKGRDGWVLNVPAKFSSSGKRERQYFRTRDLAESAGKNLREQRETFGDQAQAISPSLAEQAIAAAALLAPFGISLLDAAQEVAEKRRAIAGSVTVTKACADFTIAKNLLSSKQRQAIKHACAHLVEAFGETILREITAAQVEKHLVAKTSGTAAFNARLRILRTLWRWAGSSLRNWCDPATLKDIARQVHVAKEVGTLTAKEMARYMSTAEEHFPDCVPGCAIMMCTGLRRSELGRLRPADIANEGITIPPSSSKTRKRRFINTTDQLRAWLSAYPVSGDRVIPKNWIRKEEAIRQLAGWRVWSEILDPQAPPADYPEWPANALRHTAASVALALGKPIETLVFEHGHAGGLQTLRNHYIGRMPKKEAIAISQIGPRGTTLPAVVAA